MLSPSRVTAALIVLVLAQLVVAQSLNLFPRMIAIDFYQYWAVGAAPRITSEPLGSPYVEHRRYSAAFRDWATRTDQTKLTLNGRVLGPGGFTATPLLYTLFAALPADYTSALVVYHALQILLFLGSVVLLGRIYGAEPFPLLCLAFLLVLGSGPLLADVRLGNLGCVQLAALSVILGGAVRLRHTPRKELLAGAVLAGLAVAALVKPNVALVAVVMALHVLVAHGARVFALAAGSAVLAGAAAVALSCAYFRSWTIWSEWYTAVLGRNPYAMARPPSGGNYSTAVLISRWLGADVWLVAAIIAGALGLSLAAVLAASPGGNGGARARVRGALARAFGDPAVAMAIGVTATLAIPQLVWYHYFLIALIPSLWLLSHTGSSPYLPLFGLAALILGSGLLHVFLVLFGLAEIAWIGAALSWVPLWLGILLRIHSAPAPGAEAAATAPPAPERLGERPPRSKRQRRPRAASRA